MNINQFINQYRINVLSAMNATQSMYSLFTLSPQIILKKFDLTIEDPHLKSLKILLELPYFKENVLRYAFKNNSRTYSQEKLIKESAFDLNPKLNDTTIKSFRRSSFFKTLFLQTIIDQSINKLSIPVSQKQSFIKKIVTFYVDQLLHTFDHYIRTHPMDFPHNISLEEATKLGFVLEQYVDRGTKKEQIAYKIIDYKGDANDLTIPSSVDYIPVKRIIQRAFQAKNTLIRVFILAENITIMDEAFLNCEHIVRMYLYSDTYYNNQGVLFRNLLDEFVSISNYAFKGCSLINIIHSACSLSFQSEQCYTISKVNTIKETNYQGNKYFDIPIRLEYYDYEVSIQEFSNAEILSSLPGIRLFKTFSLIFIATLIIRLIDWNMLKWFVISLYFFYLLFFLYEHRDVLESQPRIVVDKSIKQIRIIKLLLPSIVLVISILILIS
jgi:hypothetical protein